MIRIWTLLYYTTSKNKIPYLSQQHRNFSLSTHHHAVDQCACDALCCSLFGSTRLMGNKASTMDGESTTYFEDFEDASETAASTAVGTQRSTASISSSRMSSSRSTTNNSLPLSYPYDFFNRNTGLGPKNPTEAMVLWPYRKNRPANGTVDLEPADGVKMMQEVQGMRDRLKAHIENAFMKDARLMADMWDLRVRARGTCRTGANVLWLDLQTL